MRGEWRRRQLARHTKLSMPENNDLVLQHRRCNNVPDFFANVIGMHLIQQKSSAGVECAFRIVPMILDDSSHNLAQDKLAMRLTVCLMLEPVLESCPRANSFISSAVALIMKARELDVRDTWRAAAPQKLTPGRPPVLHAKKRGRRACTHTHKASSAAEVAVVRSGIVELDGADAVATTLTGAAVVPEQAADGLLFDAITAVEKHTEKVAAMSDTASNAVTSAKLPVLPKSAMKQSVMSETELGRYTRNLLA